MAVSSPRGLAQVTGAVLGVALDAPDPEESYTLESATREGALRASRDAQRVACVVHGERSK